jgi:hypothetical protein
VVVEVFAQHVFEVAAGEDQDPVDAFAADAADPAFGVRFRDRRRDRAPVGDAEALDGGRS